MSGPVGRINPELLEKLPPLPVRLANSCLAHSNSQKQPDKNSTPNPRGEKAKETPAQHYARRLERRAFAFFRLLCHKTRFLPVLFSARPMSAQKYSSDMCMCVCACVRARG